jgi:hypothetical protein
MLRPTLDVSYPLPPQLLLEVGLPAPCRVLPPLVGQYLPGHPVFGNPARKCLHYQFRPLVVCNRVRDDKPRVVVHENSHVEPLVPTKQKRENVRLPELIGGRALEAALRVLPSRRALRLLFEKPRLVQNSAHLCLGNTEPGESREHVAYPTRPPIRVLLAQRHHRRASHLCRFAVRSARRHRRLRCQRLHATGPVRLDPFVNHLPVWAERALQLPEAHSVFDRLANDRHPQRERVCPACSIRSCPDGQPSHPINATA